MRSLFSPLPFLLFARWQMNVAMPENIHIKTPSGLADSMAFFVVIG